MFTRRPIGQLIAPPDDAICLPVLTSGEPSGLHFRGIAKERLVVVGTAEAVLDLGFHFDARGFDRLPHQLLVVVKRYAPSLDVHLHLHHLLSSFSHVPLTSGPALST